MAKDYSKITKEAREQSAQAKQSSALHSKKLREMQKFAHDASDNAKTSRKRQQKRKQS